MQIHDVVALTRDVADNGLHRGQVGTIVEIWAPDVFEVESADIEGRAYAFAAVPQDSLMPLLFQAVDRAA